MDSHDEDEVEEERPSYAPMSETEARLSAELVIWLEDELGLDTRRLFVWVRDGNVDLQGSVENSEQRRACEELLAQRPGVRHLECHLSIQGRLEGSSED